MPIINPKGNPNSQVWVVIDRPLSGDVDKQYCFSAPLGYVFDKMMRDAGFNDYYVTALRPETTDENAGGSWESYMRPSRPPIIIPLNAAGKAFCPELHKKFNAKKGESPEDASAISKYAGSILRSDRLDWPHYVVPTLHPMDVVRQWKLRDVVVNCDLAKAASELEYFNSHNQTLEVLPKIEAKVEFESFDELIFEIERMMQSEWVSNDIETIYPRAPTKTQPSQFHKILPGYPLVIGLTDSITRGISFELFRQSTKETRMLWQKLAELLRKVKSVGQNFFNFDANYYEMLGFRFNLAECRDTMHLHHLLWPELPHKLQFLIRQYTRHPYHKDEGAGWTMKDLRKMKVYNVKDICTTLEIFFKEMEEIKARGME